LVSKVLKIKGKTFIGSIVVVSLNRI